MKKKWIEIISRLRIKIMIIKIKGKKAKKRNTKRLELVRLISSFFKFFLSKIDFSSLENTRIISPPVLFKRVKDEVIYFASSNFTLS